MAILRRKVVLSSLMSLSLVSLISLVPGPALADLMINPTRIVFDKNQRSAQIDVINDGTTPATYRLNIVNRRMTENGEFQPITEPGPGDQFAGQMLVFSPRQIVLQPGTQQLVRIALRKPAELAPGEYRSHLSFDKVADPSLTNAIEAQVKPGSNEVGVTIAALIGVSIPIIVRHGETDASVTLTEVSIEKPKAPGQPGVVALQMNRTGNRSVYGDLTATFKAAGGTEQMVAQAGGVSVYVPNARRRVKLTLQTPVGTVLSGGTLTVTYKERTADGGKLLAENTVQIP
ncbi:molecular chaperone [Polaromonas sp.]|uniref:fimbrial biogenesis chaperone n=1 Tax=Polaromonas sp. TaxID=1869339 RepID=UPI003265D9C5